MVTAPPLAAFVPPMQVQRCNFLRDDRLLWCELHLLDDERIFVNRLVLRKANPRIRELTFIFEVAFKRQTWLARHWRVRSRIFNDIVKRAGTKIQRGYRELSRPGIISDSRR